MFEQFLNKSYLHDISQLKVFHDLKHFLHVIIINNTLINNLLWFTLSIFPLDFTIIKIVFVISNLSDFLIDESVTASLEN